MQKYLVFPLDLQILLQTTVLSPHYITKAQLELMQTANSLQHLITKHTFLLKQGPSWVLKKKHVNEAGIWSITKLIPKQIFNMSSV